MSLTVGAPAWTKGHFSRVAAQDDLGIEALGAGLLRELVPGVVQTSISAGYYAYYPFLLDEFERRFPDELSRSAFQAFYRRQEAAFAVACSQHSHRGNLRGINGINGATQALDKARANGEVDLSQLASTSGGYMKTGLGGYGLFYRPALEDIGVTRLGAGRNHIDRATEQGRNAAEAFRQVVTPTDYWRKWADADEVPIEVLKELGAVVCPCGIPDRADQDAIIDTLFRNQGDSDRWRSLWWYRVQSFGLLLEFHRDRPDSTEGIGEWRRALVSGRIARQPWETGFAKHRDAWRAYQWRETFVAALTTIFSCFLERLTELGVAAGSEVQESLVSSISWSEVGVSAQSQFAELIDYAAAITTSDQEELINLAESAMMAANPATIDAAMTAAVRLLAALATVPEGDDDFTDLTGRGGPDRFASSYMSDWLSSRAQMPSSEVVTELIAKLFHRHLRVATSKLTTTDHRDPFCVAEQPDGRYRLIRPDEPFWTGARFETLNHLLWTAGALSTPDGDGRPTQLGLELLDFVQRG